MYTALTCVYTVYMATTVLTVRIPPEDHQFLKDFAAQYPKDSLNSMMARWIRERIIELDQDPNIETPVYNRKPSRDEPVLHPAE